MTPDDLIELYGPRNSVVAQPAYSGLDEVDWSSLQDAYGPATKVPAQLRALVSGNREHQNFALQDLFQTIWHQGTIYSATAAVVPFLYNLLEADGPHDRSSIAYLLANIADGQLAFVHCENDANAAAQWREVLSKSGISLDEKIAEGRRYGAEMRRQLAKRLDLLYPFLRDPEPGIRSAVAVAIGKFPAIASRLLPDLVSTLNIETDKHAREALQAVVDRVNADSG